MILLASRKSAAVDRPSSAGNTNVSVHPHMHVPLPATTMIPGKAALGTEHPRIDPQTLEVDTSGSFPQETDNPQSGEAATNGSTRPPGVQTQTELPPVYSPV